MQILISFESDKNEVTGSPTLLWTGAAVKVGIEYAHRTVCPVIFHEGVSQTRDNRQRTVTNRAQMHRSLSLRRSVLKNQLCMVKGCSCHGIGEKEHCDKLL